MIEKRIYIGLILLIASLGIVTAFSGFSNPTDGEWYNISWDYRFKIEVNGTTVNRTDWPIEMTVNFSDLLPGGTFDNESIRVVEYNETNHVMHVVPSQFDKGAGYNNASNAIGELIFLMNGTTDPDQKRTFYVYFDIDGSTQKDIANYDSNISYSWDGKIVSVNTTMLGIKIDTNGYENTSGLSYVQQRVFFVPVIVTSSSERTAEYLEFYNGTINTTFDLIGNASFVWGPVRLTIIQEGPEVVFGNVSQQTGQGRVVKKYFIYNRAGPEAEGSFIKISHEFFANATVNRSSRFGAVALDVQRTFLNNDVNNRDRDMNDPYSWTWASDSSGSVAGLVNINETSSNYYAGNDTTGLGRIGIGLTNTTITDGTSIKETAVIFFATGGSDGVSEFLDVRNGSSTDVIITRNLSEKWSNVIQPSINATIFNYNETVLIKGNVSEGDPYNLVAYINATLDMGTPSTSDDTIVRLYDDGTNGDQTADDKIFTNNYTFPSDVNTTQWIMNLSTYNDIEEYLNSTTFIFNVTDVYSVDVNISNSIGIVSRQIFAVITIKNFNQTLQIPGSSLDCTFNNTNVVNKTDNLDGTWAINFTAPAQVGMYDLFCNVTKVNNTGNSTEQFTAEAPKTYLELNWTPLTPNVENMTIRFNSTFSIDVNLSNPGDGTSRDSNITLELLENWTGVIQSCGNIANKSSCVRTVNVTAPNNTAIGNYTFNLSIVWINPDYSSNTTNATVNVTVSPHSQISIAETNVTGVGADGTSKTIGTFLLESIGISNTWSINTSCGSGYACQNFNITVSSPFLSQLPSGDNFSIDIIANISLNYTPGTYNGTILVNSSVSNTTDTVIFFLTIQNKTNISMVVTPVNITALNITVFDNSTFSIKTNLTNVGNSSARYTNITYTTIPGWAMNTTIDYCGNITHNQVCSKDVSVTIPNGTAPGNYTINITSVYTNLDNTTAEQLYIFNVTVVDNPVLNVENSTLTGNVYHGQTTNPYNLTVLSTGSGNLTNITFTCNSGTVCNNLTVTVIPSTIENLEFGTNTSVVINITVPVNFSAGIHNGTLNVSTQNDGERMVTLFVTVDANRGWRMEPTFCQKSSFSNEGTVCEVNVSNIGNEDINFTIISVNANKTSTNVTNFTSLEGQNYTFAVLYNITGFAQKEYNSTFVVQALDNATPVNITLNVTILPYTPPNITIEVAPEEPEQDEQVTISANITAGDFSVTIANVTILRPNSTSDFANMSFVSQIGNVSRWTVNYANGTFGNTSARGTYNVTIYARDSIGNVGNSTTNFTIGKKVNIAATTLSSQYYQGDTATLYYSATALNGSGVEDVNVSFFVYDPNSTLIYTANRLTDYLGTFAPLPTFLLASDAIVGTYTLKTNSTYNDTLLDQMVTDQNTYTFDVGAKTVTVTGLFADIETAVVWFPNNVMRINTLIYDGEGQPVNPTTMNLTVLDPAQNTYFSVTDSSMTQLGSGYYLYSYAMPATTANGMYLAVLNVTQGTLSTMKLKAFRVTQGGPYDVRVVALTPEVQQGTPATFEIHIENKGEVTQDVFINYTIANLATRVVYFEDEEAVLTPAFSNVSFTRTPFVFSNQPLGTYKFTATVRYDNTQPPINASTTFNVLAAGYNVTEEPTGGGGGGTTPITKVTAQVTDVEAPDRLKSVFIEKYPDDLKLYPGFKRIEYVVIKNTGELPLNEIKLNVLGISADWFNITPTIYQKLSPDNTSVFVLEFEVPENAELGEYKANLIVTTSTTSDQRSITIQVVETLSDLIYGEIADLKNQYRDLLIDIGVAKSQGKPVENVLFIADEILQNINKAEINANLNNTQTALNHIKDAKILIEKAKEILSTLESTLRAEPLSILVIILILLIPLTVIIILFYLNRKKKMPKQIQQTLIHLKQIADRIKPHKPSKVSMTKEKEKLSRMLSVLDKERKESIISETAYKEMKRTIQRKLDNISKK